MKIGSIVVKCDKFDKMLAFWKERARATKNLPASVRFIFLLHKRFMPPVVKIKDCPDEKAEMQ